MPPPSSKHKSKSSCLDKAMNKNTSANIAVIGFGYVGKAMVKFFKRRHTVVVHDPYVEVPRQYHGDVNDCQLAVVCVPTPMSEDGVCDTSIVEETLEWLDTPLILIKSTIPPGTTDMLKEKFGKRIVFSPEYIGEGNYYTPDHKYPSPTEMVKHDFQIFGGDEKDTSAMVDIFIRIMGPHVFFYQVDAKTAEFIKYMENVWGGMKVTFCNEMFEACEAIGIDYNKVREGWALDSRVEKMHSAVFRTARGFGGKCYPKDINAFVKFTERAGYDPKLIKQVLASNDDFTAKNER